MDNILVISSDTTIIALVRNIAHDYNLHIDYIVSKTLACIDKTQVVGSIGVIYAVVPANIDDIRLLATLHHRLFVFLHHQDPLRTQGPLGGTYSLPSNIRWYITPIDPDSVDELASQLVHYLLGDRKAK